MLPGGGWNVAGAPGRAFHSKASANQLNRDGFVTDVRRALQQSGVEPALLTLEVAEATVMRDLDATAAHLAEIKQLGVRIALDDLDGAYAHHAELHRLPLDSLKVDRQLARRHPTTTTTATGCSKGSSLSATTSRCR